MHPDDYDPDADLAPRPLCDLIPWRAVALCAFLLGCAVVAEVIQSI